MTVSALILRETISRGSGLSSVESPLFAGGQADGGRSHQLARGGGSEAGSGGFASEKDRPAIQIVNVMAETATAFRTAWDDHALRLLLVLVFLSTLALNGAATITAGYGLEVVKLQQQVVPLGGVLHPLAIVFGSFLAAHLLGDLGEVGAVLLGTSVEIFGLLTTGAGAHFRSNAAMCYWAGISCVGLGIGLVEPAILKMLARRCNQSNSGKVFSAKFLMDGLALTVSTFVWPNYLITYVHSPGWIAGAGYFISACMLVAVFWGVVFLHLRYLR
mmetsp:Transcript_87655/g.274591  ORF Transcript_87655/g.274591 Transcript_87655/m.274591 type:complete len:274 (-) Transcript_87655:115-936(-)